MTSSVPILREHHRLEIRVDGETDQLTGKNSFVSFLKILRHV